MADYYYFYHMEWCVCWLSWRASIELRPMIWLQFISITMLEYSAMEIQFGIYSHVDYTNEPFTWIYLKGLLDTISHTEWTMYRARMYTACSMMYVNWQWMKLFVGMFAAALYLCKRFQFSNDVFMRNVSGLYDEIIKNIQRI